MRLLNVIALYLSDNLVMACDLGIGVMLLEALGGSPMDNHTIEQHS